MGEDRVAEPTQEQIQKLWEWCGWEYRRANPNHFFNNPEAQKRDMAWFHADDFIGFARMPSLDLNNLFKYAVPKLLACELETLDAPACKGEPRYCACVNYNHPRGFEGYEAKNDNPALALFWAISEIVKAEKKV